MLLLAYPTWHIPDEHVARTGPEHEKGPIAGAPSNHGAGERTCVSAGANTQALQGLRPLARYAANAHAFAPLRAFSGSSPCAGPEHEKGPIAGAPSNHGAGERT